MTQFFGQNFTEERWKKAALKNAFALLSKQRFEHAAAFFLLGNKLWDACEVCISRLGDLQLALVITRLYEGDGGPIFEKILKQHILGIDDSQTGAKRGATKVSYHNDPSPDPFLRSIACWLLQDYSTALETLLVSPGKASAEGLADDAGELSKTLDPAIFNFYFFLRSQPLLIRRNQQDYRSLGAKSRALNPPISPHLSIRSRKQPLTSVGEEALTALERNLLFSTAYHHLNHGCPVLALDVLSKLPKSSSLGADLNRDRQRVSSNRDRLKVGGAPKQVRDPSASLTGMIQSGTLGEFAFANRRQMNGERLTEEKEDDWSRPVLIQKGFEEDLDWSQPVSRGLGVRGRGLGEEGEGEIEPHMLVDSSADGEFDWGKPVSSQVDLDTVSPSLSPPRFDSNGLDAFSPPSESTHPDGSDQGSDVSSPATASLTTLSSQGLFILSLAEQLQYNACLSILTEELVTISLPSCCEFLWESKGRDSLPLLPLAKQQDEKCLALHYRDSAFEKTVLSLRGVLMVWLRREMGAVKEICGFEKSREELEESSEDYVPAGYDLLTTLMNYASLHAGTTPSLITVKLELMHLMNTLLPWSTQPTKAEQEFDGESLVSVPSGVPTCAVDPSQLPILTSCSLPAKHLTNLALHLRLMSASIIEVLANHTCPPISSKPLPHVAKVFELCCAISNSITVCLSPISFTEIASGVLSSSTASRTATTSGVSTPVVLGSAGEFMATQSVEVRQKGHLSPRPQQSHHPTSRPRSSGSLSFVNDMLEAFASPNTKPAKWPGVAKWPKVLQSDEGKDPTPMSLILAECCIAVYIGLLSVAWSWHSISDLLLLLKNNPSQKFWYQAFGGGLDVKRSEERARRGAAGGGGGGGGGGGEKSALMRKVDTMTKRIKMLRKTTTQEGEASGFGLFVAPRKTLLELFLNIDVSK